MKNLESATQIDLNNHGTFTPAENPATEKELTKVLNFDKSIFDKLPNILQTGCNTLVDKTDKDVFLLSALTCISSILTQYTTVYDGQIYYPHLNCYVIGISGSGKGAMGYAEKLMLQIEEAITKETNEKGVELCLFIPINITSTYFLQKLQENEGRGLLYDNEGTSLVNAFKSEHGDYSDIFRKSFAHETLRVARKTEKLNISVRKPKLALCLSSTLGQMTALIPDVEDGTFSRFAFYETPTDNQNLAFHDVFATEKQNYNETFERLANQTFYFYQTINTGHYEFALTASQKTTLFHYFLHNKPRLLELLGNDINGTVNRLSIIWVRIAMILTALRAYDNKENGGLKNKLLECSEIDFDIAFKIFEVLKTNAVSLYMRLPKSKQIVNTDNCLKANIKNLWASGKFKKQAYLANSLHINQAYVSMVLSGKR